MPDSDNTSVRLDVWLWAVRLFKTRNLSAEACRNGRVQCNGQRLEKPGRRVRVGDVLSVEQGPLVRTLKVRAVLDRRVGAKLVEDYCEDLTPEEAYTKAAEIRRREKEGEVVRESGTGRPTKRERRELENVLNPDEKKEALFRTWMQRSKKP